MKLSKKTGLVIGSGILVIALAGLFMVYSGRAGEQDKLNEQLASAQTNLQRIQLEPLSAQRAELEGQLSQATSQLEVVKTIFSQQPVGSVAITSILFDIADAHGVKVTEMTSSGLASDSLEGVTYSVISLTAKIEGDLPDLVSFVTTLNSYFVTGTVKSITITIPETNSEETASADIQLAVYTHQGD